MTNPLDTKINELRDRFLELKKTKDEEDAKKQVYNEYNEFCDKYPALISLVFSSKDWQTDYQKLKGMFALVEKINNKEITQHDASVKVGGQLVDEYVKPRLNHNQ